MDLAPSPRAVVFALEDLPETDRQHILSVATYLHLDIAPASWRTPLVLCTGPVAPLPSLLGDLDLSSQGPSLMLLALRLLLADAYHWPEQRWLGARSSASRAGYALYAADPERWSVESLSRELGERAQVQVQRGLLPRGPRPPASPGDRVPVLGWQVPVLGGTDPVGKLRDLRPPEQRQHRFGGVSAPLGMVPGNLTDRYRLFLKVEDVHRDGEQAFARVDLLCIDGSLGEPIEATLSLTLSALGALADGPGDGPLDDESLGEVLREVLPSCLLLSPRGELLVLDLYHLGLSARPVGELRLMGLRPLGAPTGPDGTHRDHKGHSDDEGTTLLDPSLWEPGLLSGLILPDDIRVSCLSRFVTLHFSGRRDGLPIDASVILDTRRPASLAETANLPHPSTTAPLCWPVLLDGPAPSLAISADERLLAVAAHPGQKRAGTLPPLSPACIEPSAEEWLLSHAEDLLLFSLPEADQRPVLVPCASVTLPRPMRGPLSLSLHFLPGGRSLLCHQPHKNLLCTVELPGPASTTAPVRASVRPTTRHDLLLLLGAEGGHPLRHLLRAIHHPPEDEVPGLGFLDPRSPTWREARDFSGLLQKRMTDAAQAVLRDYLATLPHTFDGDTQTTLAG
jgi:hypothetical protein